MTGANPARRRPALRSLRSLRAGRRRAGLPTEKADRLNVLKADKSICCQQQKLWGVADIILLVTVRVLLRQFNQMIMDNEMDGGRGMGHSSNIGDTKID